MAASGVVRVDVVPPQPRRNRPSARDDEILRRVAAYSPQEQIREKLHPLLSDSIAEWSTCVLGAEWLPGGALTILPRASGKTLPCARTCSRVLRMGTL